MSVPLLLGHRGARAARQFPENTLASFELCLQHGCDGFEFDVRRSADEQPVICHDATSGGRSIARTPAADLVTNSVANSPLPLLGDVLRQFAHRAFLDIELKVPGLETRTLVELCQLPPQKGYLVSSFLDEVLTAIHTLDPAIPLGFLCESRDKLQAWREAPAEWIVPHFKLVDRDLIELVHAAGKRIMVWTVNEPRRMNEFAEWAVDAIISDDTDLLVRSLR